MASTKTAPYSLSNGHNLLLLRRVIDDMIGVWIVSPADWQSFKNAVNDFGILKWDFEEPSFSINFLDLTITINRNHISTKAFQKEFNLYQYMPPRSCRPLGMMIGIIYPYENLSLSQTKYKNM